MINRYLPLSAIRHAIQVHYSPTCPVSRVNYPAEGHGLHPVYYREDNVPLLHLYAVTCYVVYM